MSPLISIIVPVYNVSLYVERCLKSLMAQTFKDIEIIVINDGSTDNSLNICYKYEKLDSRIHVYSKDNEGLGLTRNFGIKKSKGKYLAFVDSDDYVSDNMCELLYAKAVELDADVVYGNTYIDRNGIIEKKRAIEEQLCWVGHEAVMHLLLDFIGTTPNTKQDTIMEVSVWKALFKKETIESNQIFFESERKFISEDVIFDIEFFKVAKIVAAIPDYVYYYCYNGNSLSKIYRDDRFERELVLYNEIKKRLSMIGFEQKAIELRTGRLLIARARVDTFQLLCSAIPKLKKKKLLIQICDNNDYRKVLDLYPIKKLPVKYAIVAISHKYRCLLLLKILAYISQR